MQDLQDFSTTDLVTGAVMQLKLNRAPDRWNLLRSNGKRKDQVVWTWNAVKIEIINEIKERKVIHNIFDFADIYFALKQNTFDILDGRVEHGNN